MSRRFAEILMGAMGGGGGPGGPGGAPPPPKEAPKKPVRSEPGLCTDGKSVPCLMYRCRKKGEEKEKRKRLGQKPKFKQVIKVQSKR